MKKILAIVLAIAAVFSFAACGKVYRYGFYNARHDRAVGRQYSAHVPLPLDAARMHEEAQALLGTHDFAAFAASGSVAGSTVRTIYRAQVTRAGDEVTLTIYRGGWYYEVNVTLMDQTSPDLY